MRTIGGGNSAQPTNPNWTVEVEDHLGALQDLTSDAVSVEYDETTEEIVNAATVVFRRRSGVSSLAPLMTANPPIDIGRDLVIKIDPGSGTLKEVFRGRIDAVEWPKRYGDVTVTCRDQAGVIADTWIETPQAYSTTVGVALETVMQSLATDHLVSPPTVYVPVATSALVIHAAGEEPYGPSAESVLSAARTLAEAIGWTIRYRWIDAVSAWRWTLFEPSRSKTSPDHTFGASDYYDVTVMSQDITDIRNVVDVEYPDSASGGARLTESVEDATSIAAYGRRYMKISEASGSPVNNSTLATALANAALSDSKDPDALVEITCPYFWPGEIGVDLYRFTANNVHFSSDQDLAPVAFRHRLAVGERSETKILCRGKPSGGVLTWRARESRGSTTIEDPPSVYSLNDVRFADEATGRRYYWTNGAKIVELWTATATITGNVADSDWEALKSAVTLEATDIEEYLVTWPAAGQRKIARVEGRWYDATGVSSQQNAFVLKIDVPSYVTQAPRVNVSVSRSGTTATATFTASDPLLSASAFEFNKREGGAYSGWLTSWDTSTGTAGTDATLTRTETVNLARDSEIQWRITFTDESGASKTIGGTVPLPTVVLPKVQEAVTWSTSTATVALTITDPTLSLTAFQWRTITQGGTPTTLSGTWTSSTGTLGTDAALTRTKAVTVAAGTDVSFEYVGTFADETGTSRTVGGSIPLANLQSVSKTQRISCHKLVPATDTTDYAVSATSLTPGDELVLCNFFAAVDIPQGVTITALRARMERLDGTNDVAEATLYRVADSGGAGDARATATHSGTGWSTSSASCTEATSGYGWAVGVTLKTWALATTRASVAWVEIDYTAPNYSNTL